MSAYEDAPEINKSTVALVQFMEAITEIQSASVSFFSGLISVKRKIRSGGETTADMDVAEKIYNEMAFCRVIDIYQKYITDLLLKVFEKYPHSIFKRKYDISQLFDFSDIQDLRRYVIEKEVSDLSYKIISDLNVFLVEKIGCGLFRSKFEELRTQHCVYRRNTIVHNNGIISKSLCEKAGFPISWVGRKFLIPDAHRTLRYFINAAIWLDIRYTQQYDLEVTGYV